jgi:hypothetical protein
VCIYAVVSLAIYASLSLIFGHPKSFYAAVSPLLRSCPSSGGGGGGWEMVDWIGGTGDCR